MAVVTRVSECVLGPQAVKQTRQVFTKSRSALSCLTCRGQCNEKHEAVLANQNPGRDQVPFDFT